MRRWKAGSCGDLLHGPACVVGNHRRAVLAGEQLPDSSHTAPAARRSVCCGMPGWRRARTARAVRNVRNNTPELIEAVQPSD